MTHRERRVLKQAKGNSKELETNRVRTWRKNNPDKVKAQRQKAWEMRRDYINEKKKAPCADCGQTFHPEAMDFDHRPEEKKLANLSVLLNKSVIIEVIQAEIDKCDLVCACCHRVRTHKRRLTPGL